MLKALRIGKNSRLQSQAYIVVKPKAKREEKPTLMLEIRPTDIEGKVIGRSKIFLWTKESLQRLQKSIAHERLESIVDAIETYNTEHQHTKETEEKVLDF